MFRIVSKGCKGWQTIAGLLSSLHDEATFVITPEKVEFRCIDLGKVGLVDFDWSKEHFKIYECKEEQKIAISTGEFKQFLDRAKKDEDIELVNKESSRVSIIIGTTKKYDCPLINTSDRPPKLKLPYEENNRFTVSEFQNALDDLKIIGDHITMTIKNGSLEMSAQGEWVKNNGSTVILNKDIKVKETRTSKFSAEFITNIFKTVKSVTNEFELSLLNDKPLRFTFNVEDMGTFEHYIAPIQQ